MRARGVGAAAVAAMVVLGATGCIGAVSGEELTAEVQARGGGLSQVFVDDVLTALAEAAGTDRLVVRTLSFDPGRQTASAFVRDPDQPRNLDSYSVDRGRARDPNPVQVSADTSLEATTFAVADVPALGAVEALADTALAELAIDGGYVEGLSVTRSTDGVRLTVEVDGPRASGSAIFDADGELIEAAHR